MTIAQNNGATRRRPLRLWPGVVLVVLQWLVRFALPAVVPEATMYAMLGGMAGGVAVVLWWLLLSRAPWSERLGAVALMIVALAATPLVLHPSVATGAMGMLFYLYAIPALSLALVLWAAVTQGLAAGPRRASLVAAMVVACGVWALVRTSGFTGDADSDFAWRWSPTAEERLLARTADEPAAPRQAPEGTEPVESSPEPAGNEPAATTAVPAATAPIPGWPGFRGPGRDGVAAGVRIATDWSASPPVELWRRPVGPGWSSFAVGGDRVYTQEQRGDDEVVACYDAASGEPVWMHRDAVRFWESNAGAGPRATPTLHDGRVYALGATGLLNALDAADGALVWSRDAATDSGAELPTWGFAGSPLVVGDEVVVATSGTLAAYDLASGEPRWIGSVGGEGYTSPQRATIDGVDQVLMLSGDGVAGFAPADGALLWQHPWAGYPIVQPALTADGDVLIGVNADSGLRRLAVARGPAGWSADERWTSRGLKPYFNDFVVHEGHAYGFDGGILAAIGLADGDRLWKGGRYGHGQLLLLPEQDLLLVLSERGELALVAAAPDRFSELARLPVLEGKTWNHPVVSGDLLLVRNGREMVAYRLPLAGG